jgi:GT2 family glycosyltransferase
MTKKSSIDLSIIVLLYRSEETIKVLLDSIKTGSKKLRVQIILVDNAYPDQSANIAAKHPLNPTIIKLTQNVGFSRGVNLALKESKGKNILLLNADTKIIGQALERLVTFANNQMDIGAVAPRLVNTDGKPQASVFHFPTILGAIKAFFFNQRESFGKYLPKAVLQKVDVAQMAAMLIPKKIFDQVGQLDERFFFYYEDIEFCQRLKKANLPVYYLPSAKIEHVHGASGRFVEHLQSPLAKSAQVYHGVVYSNMLNCVLWVGNKYKKILSMIKRP